MKIVVDTNIIFSAILSPNGTLSDVLLNSFNKFLFFSPTFVLEELDNHKEKMLKISGYSKSDLNFLHRNLFKKIDLIDVESVQISTWHEAIQLVEYIDEFDAPFIALALELKCALWTCDKKLIKGLSQKNVDWILTTDELIKLRDE